MKIPLLFGTLFVTFERHESFNTKLRDEIRNIIFVDGAQTTERRIAAIKRYRQLTGSSLVEAIVYTNQFYPPGYRIQTNKKRED